MKTVKTSLCASLLGALLISVPATASVPIVLTQHEAHKAAKTAGEQTLGALTYRSIAGSADVHVSDCRVHGRRGLCRVVVNGIQRCEYTAHILETSDNYIVWGTRIRCGA